MSALCLKHVLVRTFVIGTLVTAGFAGAHEPGDELQVAPGVPSTPVVRTVLEGLPEVQEARRSVDFAKGVRDALKAGPYEWTVKGGMQQRRDVPLSTRYNEPEFGLEKTTRWFGKSDKDAAIGEQGIQRAQAALGDAWHESGRALLKTWFDAAREKALADNLQAQVKVLDTVLETAQKRVKAGDAARTEAMLAQAERDRTAAQWRASQARLKALELEIQSRYPQLPLPDLAALFEDKDTHSFDEAQWLGLILKHNHELELAQAEFRRSELIAERAKMERMPDPSVALRASIERDRAEKLLGLVVSVPIPGAGRAAQESQAYAALSIAQERKRMVVMRVERDGRKVINAANASVQVYASVAAASEQTRRNAQLIEKAYRMGEGQLSDVLLTRKQALESSIQADTAWLDAQEARHRLLLDAHQIWSLVEHDD